MFVLGSQRGTCDLPPVLESLLHLLPIRGRGKPMPARAEMLDNRAVGREEPLGMARGFEPLHVSLSLTGGLMRILHAIIEIPVLAMFHPWKNLALGGSVALEFICDDYTRGVG